VIRSRDDQLGSLECVKRGVPRFAAAAVIVMMAVLSTASRIHMVVHDIHQAQDNNKEMAQQT
jgi:hypothetical protein